MAIILPIDNIPCYFNILDRHVVRVTKQPFELVHHVKFTVGRLSSYIHNGSGILHILIFDLVVWDVLGGVVITLDANIARVILVLVFFEHFEWCWDFTLTNEFELTVFDDVTGEVIYFVGLQLALGFIGDFRGFEECSYI